MATNPVTDVSVKITKNDIISTAETLNDSRKLFESSMHLNFAMGTPGWVIDGLDEFSREAAPASVLFNVGSAYINGYYVKCESQINTTDLSDDTFYRIWLQLTRDGFGNVDGVVLNIDSAAPHLEEDAIMLAELKVDGTGTITGNSFNDRRKLSPSEHNGTFNIGAAGSNDSIVLGYRPKWVYMDDTSTDPPGGPTINEFFETEKLGLHSTVISGILRPIVIEDWGIGPGDPASWTVNNTIFRATI